MYKFNFLNKINQEKLETKKRDRFIKMIFISSTSCLVLLLAILFLQSLNIGSSYNSAQEYQERITKKTAEFRNKDFFKFKNIENIYNLSNKRRNITSILNIVESALDSSLILNDFIITERSLDLRFISRFSSSKSELMSRMNVLKDKINDELVVMKYIDEKKPLTLQKGPDIKKSFNEYQYWVFDFNAEFKSIKPVANTSIQPAGGFDPSKAH